VLAGIVDDMAPVDPRVSLPAAIAEYRRLRAGPAGWMLGRFVVGASRLNELAVELVRTMQPGEPAWEIGVAVDGDPAAAATDARAFHRELHGAASIVFAIATAAPGEEAHVVRTLSSIAEDTVAFVDLGDTAEAPEERVAAVSALATGERRVAGVEIRHRDAAATARMLVACAAHRVRWRTTVGPEGPDPRAFLTAGALAAAGTSVDEIAAALAGDAWASPDGGRGASDPALRRVTRARAFTGYGSPDLERTVAALVRPAGDRGSPPGHRRDGSRH